MTARLPLGTRSHRSRRQAIASFACAATIAPFVFSTGGCASAEGRAACDFDYLSLLLREPDPVIPFRKEPYRLAQSLVIPSGVRVRIEANSRFVWLGPPTGSDSGPIGVFVAGGDKTAIIAEQPAAQVECRLPNPMVFAALMIGKIGFEVSNLAATNCGHIYVRGTPKAGSRRDSRAGVAGLSRDVTIIGGGAAYTTPNAHNIAACMLAFVTNSTVTGASYRNICHGVQWWGGDANPARDGKRENIRRCGNLLIEDVTVQTASQGGIWGSMGTDIIVRNCLVDGAGDVGFDAEGSDRVRFDRCKARNARNGCFTTFFLCDSVVLENCEAYVDDRSFPLVRIYNSTQSNVDNTGFAIRGGRYVCADRRGPGAIDTKFGPVGTISLIGLTLENVRIDLAHSNMHRTVIRDTVLHLPRPLNCEPAIRVGSSKSLAGDVRFRPGGVLVTRNIIRYVVAMPGADCASVAISVTEDDFNSSAHGEIIDNVISGPFTTAVALANASANPEIIPTFVVSGNKFEQTEAGARLLTIAHAATARRPTVKVERGRSLDTPN